MSATRSATELEVRRLIDDLDPDDFAISSIRMHSMVQGQMHLLAPRTVLPMEAVTDVALLASIYDYTLTGIVGDIRQAILNSTGLALDPMNLEDLNAQYRQDTAQAAGTGTPRAYALFETSAQASKMRVAPTPSASGTIKLYYGIIPAALSADSSAIPFSAPLLRILERMVASECVAAMSEQDRAKRMIGVEVVPMWRAMADQGLRDENFRLRVLGGGTQQYVVEVED